MSKKVRVVPKTVSLRDSKFAYFSVCCNAIGEKPSCVLPSNAKIGSYLGAIVPDDRIQGLGSWRCSTCKKSCSVVRTKKETCQAELISKVGSSVVSQ